MHNMQAMSAMRPAGRQQGFTIIELVVVILLLGILAATALPRFMDVTDEAHMAVVDALQGGLTTSATLFRAQWIGKGQPGSTTAVAEFGNGVLRANSSGWPKDTASANLGDSATCVAVYNELLQTGRPTAIELDAETTATLPTSFGTAGDILTLTFDVDPADIEAAVTEALDNDTVDDEPDVAVVAVMGVSNGFCVSDGSTGCDGTGIFRTAAAATAGTGSLGTDQAVAAGQLLSGTCNYYYVGQYKTRQTGLTGGRTASQVLGLDTLSFNLNTGSITRTVLAFEP
ncbi:MAG: type II secretion system protein [Pseudomonadales bacterium]|nr:type II secretion system protein [Pseudomonadales bacterium]